MLQQNFSYAIERVEVLKGPASLLYGITDPGGLINLVSKRDRVEKTAAYDRTLGYDELVVRMAPAAQPG